MIDIFPNITDNFALNFLNTRLMRNGKVIELIQSVENLKEWSESPIEKSSSYNTQLSIFSTYIEGIDTLDPVITFRNYLHELLVSFINREVTENEIKELIEEETLANPFSLIFVDKKVIYVPTKNGLEGIKALVFLSLSELIESKELNKISRCANDSCPLLFINKNGRRKWCSMKICGNRSKVERFENKKNK
ncbi:MULTISPECIES: CGNR zinc finger domain-containing protein [Vagococcus]|uniref:Zinc finger CGNR domain-containing protein n=1 Tax=Vagococcus fluvialis bH819 TaxID=1255619 RepID=A0A1X6WNG9_9ENTE|nr:MULTISPECIES: CGNR zinc finger domain-containing protein [Vagococcus]SLM85808.1 hypothetical protein FM121_06885 [Vagococcus fluvialis bH819]HCM90230.1 hypothetical protein [Vagococcus sp.]